MNFKRYCLRVLTTVVIVLMGLCTQSKAAGIVATASGNWSSSASWGGVVPPTTIAIDQIAIPSGIVITLDQNLNLSGLTASLKVDGTLMVAEQDTVDVQLGTLSGSGSLQAGTIHIEGTALMSFSGSIVASSIVNQSVNLQLGAQTRVQKQLSLQAGVLSLVSGGSISVSPGASIVMNGGAMVLSGGALDLQESYTVHYLQATALCGAELNGSGLRSVTIDIPAGSSLNLSSDLILDGDLQLNSGSLVLSDHSLYIGGRIVVSSSAALRSTLQSSISLHSQTSLSSVLRFAAGSDKINSLNLSLDSGSNVMLMSDLTVGGNLNIQGGSVDFSGHALRLQGELSGSGMLRADASSVLTISTTAGLQSALRFDANANTVQELVVDIGQGNVLNLASDLHIQSRLNIVNRSKLSIRSERLWVNGTLVGNGSFVADANSKLYLKGNTGTTYSLNIEGDALGVLSADVGSGSTVSLASDITVQDSLALKGATLDLNGFDVDVHGVLLCSVGADIASSGTSSLRLSSGASSSSVIRFAPGLQHLANLWLEQGSTASLSLSGMLQVQSDARFSVPHCLLDAAELHVSGMSHFSDSTRFSSVHHSSIWLDASASVDGSVRFSSEANELDNFVVATTTADTLRLDGTVAVATLFEFSTGVLAFDSTNLTLRGNLVLGTAAAVSTTGASSIELSGNGTYSSALVFVNGANTINTLRLNIDSLHQATVKGSVDVIGQLDLQSGTLALSDCRLGIAGNFHESANASLASDLSSDLSIHSTQALSSALSFRADAQELNSLFVHCADGSAVTLGSDLRIHSTLQLDATKLNVGNHELMMSESAMISGVDEHAYVVLTAQGRLSRHLAQTTQDTLDYPVGNSTAYLAAQLVIQAADAGAVCSVGVQDSVRSNGLQGSVLAEAQPVVNATWNIQSTSQASFLADLRVQWPAALESPHFDRSAAYLSAYTGSTWDIQPSSSAQAWGSAAFRMERKGLNQASP